MWVPELSRVFLAFVGFGHVRVCDFKRSDTFSFVALSVDVRGVYPAKQCQQRHLRIVLHEEACPWCGRDPRFRESRRLAGSYSWGCCRHGYSWCDCRHGHGQRLDLAQSHTSHRGIGASARSRQRAKGVGGSEYSHPMTFTMDRSVHVWVVGVSAPHYCAASIWS